MAKRTTSSRKTTATRSRRPAQRKRPAPSPAFDLALRPEHQRELFALALITVAAITIVFFLTGSAGAFGQRWVEFTERLLGWGALARSTGAWAAGRGDPVAGAPRRSAAHRRNGARHPNAAEGRCWRCWSSRWAYARISPTRSARAAGWWGIQLLQLALLIGRPATFVVYCVFGLAGVLLTFNITLRELTLGMRDSFARFWITIWSAPEAYEAPAGGPLREPPSLRPADPPFVPPPGADDIVSTPIAARPTRASLFDRPEVKAKPLTSGEPKPAPKPKASAQPVAEPRQAEGQPGPNTLLTNLLTNPAGTAPAQPAAAAAGVVQEPLDGFEVSAVHQAWPLPTFDLLELYTSSSITDEERS